MKDIDNLEKQNTSLLDDEMEKIAVGSDIDSLKFSGKTVVLPEARSKKKCDGGYDGKILPRVDEITISESDGKIIP